MHYNIFSNQDMHNFCYIIYPTRRNMKKKKTLQEFNAQKKLLYLSSKNITYGLDNYFWYLINI